jgi:hypothetical protein
MIYALTIYYEKSLFSDKKNLNVSHVAITGEMNFLTNSNPVY